MDDNKCHLTNSALHNTAMTTSSENHPPASSWNMEDTPGHKGDNNDQKELM